MEPNLPVPPVRTNSPSEITLVDYPKNPNFDFINNLNNKKMITSAYQVMQQNTHFWKILENFDEESFMFSNNKEVINIMGKIDIAYNSGHSGASMGLIMRELEYIAKNGFQAYKERLTSQ